MGRGCATFEWIEDGAFLVERSHAAWTDPGWVENAPVSTQSVMGFDDTTFEVTSSTPTTAAPSGSTAGL